MERKLKFQIKYLGHKQINAITTNNNTDDRTPTDFIDDAFRQINSALGKDLLTKILEMSPLFFEKLVVELLVKMGYGGSFEDAASTSVRDNRVFYTI